MRRDLNAAVKHGHSHVSHRSMYMGPPPPTTPVQKQLVEAAQLRRERRAAKLRALMERGNATADHVPPLDPHQRLGCWANDYDHWIGHSLRDVMAMHAANGADDPVEASEWHRCDPKQMLTIHLDDGRGAVRQSIARWIRENRRGMLASENC